MSAVAASLTFACTASLSSVLTAASWSSFWFSPLAIFCCALLILEWFSWGRVVPAHVVVLFFYMF